MSAVTTTRKTGKKMSVFSLMMISIIAVDSLRTLPISAHYGFSLVFYYLLMGVLFFVPTALVSAELATGWPKTGGLYVWVREAFGAKAGFVAIWLQWFYNICWYPTILALVAAMIAYCINPSLASNKLYTVSIVLATFWGVTWINLRGLKLSSLLVNVTAIIGTLVPMLFIIILGIIWLWSGRPIEISFSTNSFFPQISNAGQLTLLTAVLYSLMGMELSASHAQDVKNPQRDYPRALFGSAVIILLTLTLASLSVAMIVPKSVLSTALLTGTIDAFKSFLTTLHLPWLIPVVAIAIALGAIGAVSAWVIGPAKGLLSASHDNHMPNIFRTRNHHDTPATILLVQAVICSLLSLVYLLMPSVNTAFWLLTNITAILSLLVYIFIFLAAIRLRYKAPAIKRSFTIPGGKVGMWLVAGSGLVVTTFTIIVGFIPPQAIAIGNVFAYEFTLIVGVIVCGIILPLSITYAKGRYSRTPPKKDSDRL